MTEQHVASLQHQRVYVAGHTGMAGSAIARRLQSEGCDILTTTRSVVDLRRQAETEESIRSLKPNIIIMAAGHVGGIVANDSYPVDFLADNLAMQLNVITSAHRAGVERLLFLGSTCIYPRDAAQPLQEEAILTGPLEATNEWYAVAKIAGIKLCQAFRRQFGRNYISVMPTNLYGRGDNYHPQHSHVVAALVRRFHEAKEANAEAVTVWGSGRPRREFLHSDDFADACIFLLQRYNEAMPINIGIGHDITIAELARSIADTVGFKGDILFDPSKPDGTPRKLVDVARLSALGWKAKMDFTQGLAEMYEDFKSSASRRREV